MLHNSSEETLTVNTEQTNFKDRSGYINLANSLKYKIAIRLHEKKRDAS